MNTFTPPQLLARLAENDRTAFETIYHQYWNDLYQAAYRRLKNPEQARDIIQDIFINLWERRGALHIDNLGAYLHAAVRYRIYNYISRDLVSERFYEPFETIAVYPVSADAVILEKELLQLAEAYVQALPKKRQLIFNLYVNDNLSTAEIARRLHISRKTVQNQLSTAMTGLKTHLMHCILCIVLLLPLTH